ncbi:hypothetical protein [Herbaspirillum sp. RV1423]|uniref:hypothetical protein n=1 Tax=Herbaspirillum sp. RV1423 TaxID=1443993 RepID=UPI0004B279CA|nr:hypothetical protein [Herbaspirillum sp. RV1423]
MFSLFRTNNHHSSSHSSSHRAHASKANPPTVKIGVPSHIARYGRIAKEDNSLQENLYTRFVNLTIAAQSKLPKRITAAEKTADGIGKEKRACEKRLTNNEKNAAEYPGLSDAQKQAVAEKLDLVEKDDAQRESIGYTRLKQEIDGYKDERDDIKKEKRQAEHDLRKLKRNKKISQKEYDKSEKKLNAKINKLQSDLDTIDEELKQLDTRKTELKKQLEPMLAEIDAINKKLDQLEVSSVDEKALTELFKAIRADKKELDSLSGTLAALEEAPIGIGEDDALRPPVAPDGLESKDKLVALLAGIQADLTVLDEEMKAGLDAIDNARRASRTTVEKSGAPPTDKQRTAVKTSSRKEAQKAPVAGWVRTPKSRNAAGTKIGLQQAARTDKKSAPVTTATTSTASVSDHVAPVTPGMVAHGDDAVAATIAVTSTVTTAATTSALRESTAAKPNTALEETSTELPVPATPAKNTTASASTLKSSSAKATMAATSTPMTAARTTVAADRQFAVSSNNASSASTVTPASQSATATPAAIKKKAPVQSAIVTKTDSATAGVPAATTSETAKPAVAPFTPNASSATNTSAAAPLAAATKKSAVVERPTTVPVAPEKPVAEDATAVRDTSAHAAATVDLKSEPADKASILTSSGTTYQSRKKATVTEPVIAETGKTTVTSPVSTPAPDNKKSVPTTAMPVTAEPDETRSHSSTYSLKFKDGVPVEDSAPKKQATQATMQTQSPTPIPAMASDSKKTAPATPTPTPTARTEKIEPTPAAAPVTIEPEATSSRRSTYSLKFKDGVPVENPTEIPVPLATMASDRKKPAPATPTSTTRTEKIEPTPAAAPVTIEPDATSSRRSTYSLKFKDGVLVENPTEIPVPLATMASDRKKPAPATPTPTARTEKIEPTPAAAPATVEPDATSSRRSTYSLKFKDGVPVENPTEIPVPLATMASDSKKPAPATPTSTARAKKIEPDATPPNLFQYGIAFEPGANVDDLTQKPQETTPAEPYSSSYSFVPERGTMKEDPHAAQKSRGAQAWKIFKRSFSSLTPEMRQAILGKTHTYIKLVDFDAPQTKKMKRYLLVSDTLEEDLVINNPPNPSITIPKTNDHYLFIEVSRPHATRSEEKKADGKKERERDKEQEKSSRKKSSQSTPTSKTGGPRSRRAEPYIEEPPDEDDYHPAAGSRRQRTGSSQQPPPFEDEWYAPPPFRDETGYADAEDFEEIHVPDFDYEYPQYPSTADTAHLHPDHRNPYENPMHPLYWQARQAQTGPAEPAFDTDNYEPMGGFGNYQSTGYFGGEIPMDGIPRPGTWPHAAGGPAYFNSSQPFDNMPPPQPDTFQRAQTWPDPNDDARFNGVPPFSTMPPGPDPFQQPSQAPIWPQANAEEVVIKIKAEPVRFTAPQKPKIYLKGEQWERWRVGEEPKPTLEKADATVKELQTPGGLDEGAVNTLYKELQAYTNTVFNDLDDFPDFKEAMEAYSTKKLEKDEKDEPKKYAGLSDSQKKEVREQFKDDLRKTNLSELFGDFLNEKYKEIFATVLIDDQSKLYVGRLKVKLGQLSFNKN